MAADDSVAAHEAFAHVKVVHRPTSTLGAARGLAEQLGHGGFHVADPGEVMAMVAVGGDDVIGGLDRGDGTDGDRLLANVEVEEPADLTTRVRPRRFFFKAANPHHIAVDGKH